MNWSNWEVLKLEMAVHFREAKGANTVISNTQRRGGPGHRGAPTSTGSWVPEEGKEQRHLQTAALPPAQHVSSGKPTHLPPELGHPGPRQLSPMCLLPLFPALRQMLLAMLTIALWYISCNHPFSDASKVGMVHRGRGEHYGDPVWS